MFKRLLKMFLKFLAFGALVCVLGLVLAITNEKNETLGLAIFLIGIFIAFMGLIAVFLSASNGLHARREREKEQARAEELGIEDDTWKEIVAEKFYLNEDTKQVLINTTKYAFDEILDCELIEDNQTITKSSMLDSAVKGAVFGLAGYLSGSKKTSSMCQKMELRITVKNFSNPVEYLTFIDKKVPKDGFIYDRAIKKAEKCLSIIKIIIDQNNT